MFSFKSIGYCFGNGFEFLSALLVFAVCHDSEVFRTRNFPLSITLALLVCTNSQRVLFSSYETITVANAKMLPFVRFSLSVFKEFCNNMPCMFQKRLAGSPLPSM